MDENRFLQCAEGLARQCATAEWLDLAPGRGLLIPDWLDEGLANGLFESCLRELDWEQPNVRLFGRNIPIPRQHAFLGDPHVIYRWSGLEQRPQPWIPLLAELRRHLGRAGFCFNSILANHYRDGGDSMGWHADNERELGPHPVVATVSLGEVRRLSFRQRGGAGRLGLPLASGSLLLTSGLVQLHWVHQVAKSARVLGPRLSLTFRYINR